MLAALLLLRATVTDWNHVPSGSMQPSLLVGDRILVDKLAYGLQVPFTAWRPLRWGVPARGDVVTFDSPADGRLMVKRVVGVPGDLVELADNRLAINGAMADYQPLDTAGVLTGDGRPARQSGDDTTYAHYRERLLGSERLVRLRHDGSASTAADFAPVRVPEGHYLMLGDNRDHSRDSRHFGFVARDRIVGRATAVVFSLDRANHYLPRPNRYLAELR